MFSLKLRVEQRPAVPVKIPFQSLSWKQETVCLAGEWLTSAWRKQLEGSTAAEHNVLFRITQLINISIKWEAHVSGAHTHSTRLNFTRNGIERCVLLEINYTKFCIAHAAELTHRPIYGKPRNKYESLRYSSNTIYNQSERQSWFDGHRPAVFLMLRIISFRDSFSIQFYRCVPQVPSNAQIQCLTTLNDREIKSKSKKKNVSISQIAYRLIPLNRTRGDKWKLCRESRLLTTLRTIEKKN